MQGSEATRKVPGGLWRVSGSDRWGSVSWVHTELQEYENAAIEMRNLASRHG